MLSKRHFQTKPKPQEVVSTTWSTTAYYELCTYQVNNSQPHQLPINYTRKKRSNIQHHFFSARSQSLKPEHAHVGKQLSLIYLHINILHQRIDSRITFTTYILSNSNHYFESLFRITSFINKLI